MKNYLIPILLVCSIFLLSSISSANALLTLTATGGQHGSAGGTGGSPFGGDGGGYPAGAGTNGIFVNITGTNTRYGGGGGAGTNTFGCSGTNDNSGLGGGGHGGFGNPPSGHDSCQHASNGVDGLGGGAGAGFFDTGQNGGSGVVIVAYPTGSFTATGGTISFGFGKTIHTFTSNGTFSMTSGSGNIEVLVVGGGGGANGAGSNGGGGGGVDYEATYSATPFNYGVIIGNGGGGQCCGNGLDTSGTSSSFTPQSPTIPSMVGSSSYGVNFDQMQAMPNYVLSDVSLNPCITQVQLFNYTNLLQTIAENACPTTANQSFQPLVITQSLNTYSNSSFTVYTTWNQNIIDVNNANTITTISHFSFIINKNNATHSLTSSSGGSGYTPTPPAPETSSPTPTSENPSCPTGQICVNPFNLFGGQGGNPSLFSTPINAINFSPKSDTLSPSDSKTETISATWQTDDLMTINQITIDPSPFTITPNLPFTSTTGRSTTFSYSITAPTNYCDTNIKTNCLDPNIILYSIPVTIYAKLADKDQTISHFNLTFTVLKPQTVATYTIIALISFVAIGMVLQRTIFKKGKRRHRR